MRRLVTVFLAGFMLILPSAALAQSAGDEQYADPFGQTEQPNGGQDQQTQAPADSAPAPAQTTAPATPAADQAVASQETAAPTLPHTGLPAGLVAGTGALLLLAGTTMRRRVS
jgi:hypothetical protein